MNSTTSKIEYDPSWVNLNWLEALWTVRIVYDDPVFSLVKPDGFVFFFRVIKNTKILEIYSTEYLYKNQLALIVTVNEKRMFTDVNYEKLHIFNIDEIKFGDYVEITLYQNPKISIEKPGPNLEQSFYNTMEENIFDNNNQHVSINIGELENIFESSKVVHALVYGKRGLKLTLYSRCAHFGVYDENCFCVRVFDPNPQKKDLIEYTTLFHYDDDKITGDEIFTKPASAKPIDFSLYVKKQEQTLKKLIIVRYW